MKPVTSLSEVHALASSLPPHDDDAQRVAAERQLMLTKPQGSLGRLEEMAIWLAGWQGVAEPRAETCQTIVFAGNHGIAARGVSAFPSAVTGQMVANFKAGGAAINQLCKSVGSHLDVRALDLDHPTEDFSQQAAMTPQICIEAINLGIGAVNLNADVLALGEMGIGNTTSAAALCCGIYGGDPSLWVGRGTGIDDVTFARKSELIRTALEIQGKDLDDPVEVLRCFGGRELAAIFGAIRCARRHRIPVILDGFVCTAAAAPLAALASGGLDHCLIGHCSVEPGHQRLMEKLEKKAVFDLDMRLGEASGAALALGLIKASVAVHNGMATFAEAGVSEQ